MNVFPIIQKIFDDNNIHYSIVKKERQIMVKMPVQENVFAILFEYSPQHSEIQNT